MTSKKESRFCIRRHGDQGSCSKIVPVCCLKVQHLNRGCFDPPAGPGRQLCTLGTGRALEPRSHLAAIVCPGGPGARPPPPPPYPITLSLSHSLAQPRSPFLLPFSISFALSSSLSLHSSLSLSHGDLWSN